MQWAKQKYQTGFTIVELLIVIVVIAILAAITIIAYTGITKRAQTSAYASAADQVEKTLRLAITQNPSLTTAPGQSYNWVCFGMIEDYPAEGPFNTGDCFIAYDANGNETERYSTSSDFSTQLASTQFTARVGQLPTVTLKTGDNTYVARGVFGYLHKSATDATTTVMMQWLTPDRSSCTRSSEFISQIEQFLASLIDIRDGHKTIEEVFGPDSGITMTMITDSYIPIYQQIVDAYNTGGDKVGICMQTFED